MTAAGDDERGGPDRPAEEFERPATGGSGPFRSSGHEPEDDQPTAPQTPPLPLTAGGPDRPSPQRPPVPTGVPPRPAPLPPPRPHVTGADRPTAAFPASAATTNVLPGERAAGRSATPRAPLTAPRPVKGRTARLALRRLDPWSVLVTSLLVSLLLAVATIVAAIVLYAVLDKLGIPKSINKTAGDVQGGGDVLTRGRFLGAAALLAAIDVVLLTALATLGSMLYNLCATFTGGLELTLAERD